MAQKFTNLIYTRQNIKLRMKRKLFRNQSNDLNEHDRKDLDNMYRTFSAYIYIYDLDKSNDSAEIVEFNTKSNKI